MAPLTLHRPGPARRSLSAASGGPAPAVPGGHLVLAGNPLSRDRALAQNPGAAYSFPVPRYEYRCRACGSTFERTRPMSEASDSCLCPEGHDDTVKLLSTVSVGGRASAASPRSGGGGGGCCGGGCGCG
jgi:putative FmdB family regulatory protein